MSEQQAQAPLSPFHREVERSMAAGLVRRLQEIIQECRYLRLDAVQCHVEKALQAARKAVA